MRPTSTNLTSSPWAQPARTPAQAEEAKLEVDEQARLIRVGADPIHHQPPQPGHLGGQGQVVARRYCRKSSRLMSARRGMSTITFPRWASFSALGRSERAAAVGRLTELQHRQLWGGRGMQNWQGTFPCMWSLPSRPAHCLGHRRNCRLVRAEHRPTAVPCHYR